MRRIYLCLLCLTTLICIGFARAQRSNYRKHKITIEKPLEIYFIDVEGGQSTLFVTPAQQSLLVDTGWPDHDGRDAERILAAAKLAGIDHIDYLLISHFHQDHVGGVPNLAKLIPIGTCIDHGANREPQNAATEQAWKNYQTVLARTHVRHVIARPGDTIPLAGVKVTVVSADGKLIDAALPGAGQPNPFCETSPVHPADQTENARSVGIVLEYGNARVVDLGDLTWAKERQLMCPVNKLGQADVFVVSHHGTAMSDSPALVDGLAPRVAVMDNGENKGGAASVWNAIEHSPRLQGFWQLHYAAAGGAQHNVPSDYIANLKGGSDGNCIRVSLYPNGAVQVFNSRLAGQPSAERTIPGPGAASSH